jgi:hypothetical protein
VECTSGQVQARTGSTTCEPCAEHMFQPAAGAAKCISCDYMCPGGQFHSACGGSDALRAW